MMRVPHWMAVAVKGKKRVHGQKGRLIPIALIPAMMGTLAGGQLGAYYGAKRGHEAVTGRKEK